MHACISRGAGSEFYVCVRIEVVYAAGKSYWLVGLGVFGDEMLLGFGRLGALELSTFFFWMMSVRWDEMMG